MNKITIFFLTIIFLQIIYFFYYYFHWKKILGNSINIQQIEFNKNNTDELRTLMTNFLNERVKLLEKMSYNEWIDYNNKNILLEFQGKKYYLYIYEKNNNVNSDFVLRASYQKDLLNLEFLDEVTKVNQKYIILEQFPINPKLIYLMYSMVKSINGCGMIDYNWESPFNKRAVQKNAYFTTFTKNENHKTIVDGVIGIGYDVADLDYEYSDIYLDYIGIPFFIFVIFMIFMLSTIMYYIIHKESYLRPGIIFIILTSFLLSQVSLIGSVTNIQLEQVRLTEVTSATLGMSFLVAVNIFIIQSLKKIANQKINKNLYSESILLFSASLIFLLCSMYKQTNYTEANGLRTRRIQNQIFFNMSIFMNFGIFLNYLLFTTKAQNVFKKFF